MGGWVIKPQAANQTQCTALHRLMINGNDRRKK